MKNFIKTFYCHYFVFIVYIFTWQYRSTNNGACLTKYDLSAKLTSLFIYSCHQQPDRSFWLLGYPIALCCRCLGFYLGVAISTIVALIGKFNLKLRYFVIFLLFTTTDIFANFIWHKDTRNITRFITGIIMGLLFTMVLNYICNINRRKMKNEN